MKTPWSYKDIINFEYFCYLDKDKEEGGLHRRDRNILLDHQKSIGSKGSLTRLELLRLWIAVRVDSEFPSPAHHSPGALLDDALRLAKNLAIVIGLLVGLVGGFSFFTYNGSTPINVFHFFLIFIASQIALAVLVLGACLLRLVMPTAAPPSFYSLLFRGMLRRLAGFLHKPLLRTFDNEKRAGFTHALDIFRSRGTVYGSLFYWPLFALVQLFAVFYNIGLLASTMVKIATSDLAFGWQSTLQLSSQLLHRAVQLVATPWSWFLPASTSYPSITEIDGSRIILKDGIYHLASGNLTAWWPFLVLSLLFYGLFLRLGFTVLGRLLEERALSHLDFDNAACLTVIRRMRTPLVSTQAVPEVHPAENGNMVNNHEGETTEEDVRLLPQVMLVPDDIFGLCPTEKLIPLLRRQGFAIKSVHTFMTGYDEDEELKDILAEQCHNPKVGLFILMEGWMPPLVSFLTYVKELRELLPEKTVIHLGLVGRPVRSGFTPLAAQDLAIWRKKLSASRDPFLHVFSLIT